MKLEGSDNWKQKTSYSYIFHQYKQKIFSIQLSLISDFIKYIVKYI